MSSEPSPSPPPPPPPGVGGATNTGPSPQKIGQAFIRQYYQTLLTNPSQLNRFYQPDSTVTRGMEPSALATPAAFNLDDGLTNGGAATAGDGHSPGERIRRAFFEWAGEGVVIDLERGAIDAQEAIAGGILLVVTGHAFLPGADGVVASKPSPFVHTFFLNNAAGPGRKKMFLIKNDILRFLEQPAEPEPQPVPQPMPQPVPQPMPHPVPQPMPQPVPQALPQPVPQPEVEEPDVEVAEKVNVEVEEVVEQPEILFEENLVEAEPPVEEEPAVIDHPSPIALVEEPVLVTPPPVPIEPVPLVPVEYEPSADEEKVEEEDEVEEPILMTQHTLVDVDPAADEEKIEATETSSAASDTSPAVSPSSDGSKKKKNRKKRGSKSRSRSNSPRKEEEPKQETPEKPKVPSSWANLVASGGSGAKGSEGKKGRRGSPKGSRGGIGGSSAEKPTTPQESTKAPPQSQQPAKEAPPTTSSTPAESRPPPVQPQRTPESTLFIRNIPDKTQEHEIRALFEQRGAATGNRILGITLNPNRGFCFVDFDGPAAVTAIVAESYSSLVKDQRTGRKIESSFMVHGRVLDVERKVQTDRSGGKGGMAGGRRFNRSHSPKDGGGRYRGSRGGMRRSPPRGGGGNR